MALFARALGIFGSQAQGREKPESGLDLLVVIRSLPRQRFARHRLLSPIRSVGASFAETVAMILSHAGGRRR